MTFLAPGFNSQLIWTICITFLQRARFEIKFSVRHEGSTVSSINCDHWLMLCLETLSN